MLKKFEIKGVHTTVDDNLQKYVTKKIGHLDKYLPRAYRDSAHAIVELKEMSKVQDGNKYICAVTLHLPQGELNVAESTMNMYAAVDIANAKLKLMIDKYKQQHASGKWARHLTGRLRRRDAAAELTISTAEPATEA